MADGFVECEHCAEQRARRLAVEQELEAMARISAGRTVVTRWRERKVYKPMPPREVVKVQTIVQHVKVPVPVDRPVLIDVPGPAYERPAGFFGRLGDRIDRWFSHEP
jgi:hypothetical protein